MRGTDGYTAPINFPFVAIGDDGVHTIAQGTPLVQVIPFRRSDLDVRGAVRAETPEEAAQRTRVNRSTTASDGWYRRAVRGRRHRHTGDRS